jgi:hypothetical protein
VIAMALLGWVVARALGRTVQAAVLRPPRSRPSRTVSFLIRLLPLGIALLAALRIAPSEGATTTK